MAVNATAVWRVRPSGSNTNGGGYDPGIAGAATDYSQQNAAQASGTHGTAAGTATFTDLTAANFTSAMIGNAMYLTGTGFTTGWYFVVAFSSSTVVTLDRSPGTGTATGTWNLGGGWSDFWTNTVTGNIAGGNIVYILGSGTPNPASYTYDYTATSFSPAPGASGNPCLFANDPSTPGYKVAPDTTGGMPVIKFTVASIFSMTDSNCAIQGLWFVAASGVSSGSSVALLSGTGGASYLAIYGCVLDQFGFDVCACALSASANSAYITLTGCEFFSSVSAAAGSYAAVYANVALASYINVIGCNVHDCISYGIYSSTTAGFVANRLDVLDSIVAKNGKTGIYCDSYQDIAIKNCTIDGNGLNGIDFGTFVGFPLIAGATINNIISNHTSAGAYGIKAASASQQGALVDFNTFYNNATDTFVGYGPHDTHGGANPYVGQSTENYTLL